MNRRECALSTGADQPKPLPHRKFARAPFVPVLVQPLDAAGCFRSQPPSETCVAHHPRSARLDARSAGQGRVAPSVGEGTLYAREHVETRVWVMDDVDHFAAFTFCSCAISAAQMKPLSSRATATLAFVVVLPRATSRRCRRWSLAWHLSAIAMAHPG